MNIFWTVARTALSTCCLWVSLSAQGQTSEQTPPEAAVTSEQPATPDDTAAKYSMADLEKIVAPIALYPDVLVAQVLPASTVPLQVVEAARYAEKNPGKTAIPPGKNWEPPIVSLLGFPDALKKLNEDLTWLQQLGDAVIEQQEDVMTAIQNVRKRVNDKGALPSNEQQVVIVEQEVVKIVPADPEVVYVPSYNPSVVYVDDDDDDELVAGFIGFGVGMAVGACIWDDCDWHGGGIWHHGHGDVDIETGDINIDRSNNFEGGDRNREVNREGGDRNRETNRNVDRSKTRENQWKPSSSARTEHQARKQSEARARNPGSGVKPSNVSASQRNAQDRNRSSGQANRSSSATNRAASSTNRAGSSSSRPTSSTRSSTRSSSGSRDSAFSGSSSGSSARQQSSRGSSSRSSASRSSGGSRSSGASRGGGSRGGGGRGGGGRR